MFKDRTKKFDQGMLLNTLTIEKGLNIQIDSELAEYSKRLLDSSYSRLPKKGTAPNLLEQEQQRDQRREIWNKGYLDLLSTEIKFTDFYARNTVAE